MKISSEVLIICGILATIIGFSTGISQRKITSPQIEKCRQLDGEYTLIVNGVQNIERCKVNKNIKL